MGESSYLVHDFSHGPDNSGGESKVNTVSASGGSISFGKFLSESLDWGRWSSFCHNRYLEEVEKYSTPGSVAQKKAYFEAHYKRAAAKKSASLLEQSNWVTSSTIPESEELSNEVAPDKAEEVEMPNTGTDFLLYADEPNLNQENYGMDGHMVSSLQIESPEEVDDLENKNKSAEIEGSRTRPYEKQPLKESSITNEKIGDSIEKKPRSSILKSLRSSTLPHSPASKLPLSRAKPLSSVICVKEYESTPSSKKDRTGSSDKKKSTPLHMSINLTPNLNRLTDPLLTKTSPHLEKVGNLKVSSTSLKAYEGCSHPLKTPTRAPSNGGLGTSSVTPQSGNGRSRTPSRKTLTGEKPADTMFHTFSINYLKSTSSRSNRAWTPVASSSLSFKSDERLEKKKEGKADSEIRKLRQSLCFKARPLPHFYSNNQLRKNEIKKIPLTQLQSPEIGRKSNSKPNSDSNSLPLSRPSFKADKSKRITENNTPSRSVTSITNKRQLRHHCIESR